MRLRKLAHTPKLSRAALRWLATDDREGKPHKKDNPDERVDPPNRPPVDGAHAAAAGGLSILRSSVVDKAQFSPRLEPTAANSGSTILAPANHFIRVSTDNGVTYRDSLDPSKLLPASLPGLGYVGDATPLSVDRGDHSLMTLTSISGPNTEGNVVQVAVFDSRDEELSDDNVDVANACTFNFAPANFHLPRDRWLDHPQVGSSDGFLHVTADVYTVPANGVPDDGDFVESIAWRVNLSTIESECRKADPQAHATFFVADSGTGQIIPVNGAGSTMFFARHRDSATSTDKLRIWKWPDGGEPVASDHNISNWPSYSKEQKCPVDSSGHNPCAFNAGSLSVGFRTGDTVGWVWGSAQGHQVGAQGFKWPHIRAVAFTTGDLTNVEDTQIFSDTTALTYPSVAANASGKLAVVFYRMGGQFNPQARAFIVNDPRNWSVSPQPLNVNSTAAKEVWGDYEIVHPYDGCSNNFLVGLHSLQGKNVEARSVLFGAEGATCPADYQALVSRGNPDTVKAGNSMFAGASTFNSGFTRGSGDSHTVFYLSHNPNLPHGKGAFQLESTDAVPSLDPGGPVALGSLFAPSSRAFPVPTHAEGDYYLTACADNHKVIAEMTQANNCDVFPHEAADGPPLTVTDPHSLLEDASLAYTDVPASAHRHGLLFRRHAPAARAPSLGIAIESTGISAASLSASKVVIDAGPTTNFRQNGTRLGISRAKAGKVASISGPRRLRQVRQLTLRVPHRIRPGGRWYLRACVRPPAKVSDGRFANDCRVTRRRVLLRR